jgi:hypothetical protein
MERKLLKSRAFAFVAALGLAAVAAACPNCKKDYTFGMPMVVGNGMAFSWVKMDPETNKPTAVGVTLTETALEGLPTELEGDMEAMEMRLELPQGIDGIVFDHIGLDWVPKGHIPVGVYDVPHFDVHFYLIDGATRSRITATGDDVDVCRKPLPEGFMAPGYILPPEVEIPTMGAHWVDPESPEFQGKPFTSTFLYGSYDGRLAFFEPMVATSFLRTKPDQTWDLKVPAKYDRAGYYPTKYRVAYNAERKEYTISLEGLVYRAASVRN